MRRIVLVNPNTDATVTEAMLAIGRAALAEGFALEGRTAAFGAPLITEEPALERSGLAVEAVAATLEGEALAGVVVAAFGDPGLAALRQRLAVPVTGIAEASMLEAAAGGRRFAIVTTTPKLEASIRARAAAYGVADRLVGMRFTAGDPVRLTADPEALLDALREGCREAIAADGAEAIVIGGGPLAHAARQLAAAIAVPVVEPIPAAMRLAMARALGR